MEEVEHRSDYNIVCQDVGSTYKGYTFKETIDMFHDQSKTNSYLYFLEYLKEKDVRETTEKI